MRIQEAIYLLNKTRQKYGNIEVVIPPQDKPNVVALHGLTILSVHDDEHNMEVFFVALGSVDQTNKEQTL